MIADEKKNIDVNKGKIIGLYNIIRDSLKIKRDNIE